MKFHKHYVKSKNGNWISALIIMAYLVFYAVISFLFLCEQIVSQITQIAKDKLGKLQRLFKKIMIDDYQFGGE